MDARFLRGRFVLATMVILLALAAAGVVGLSRLAAQHQRNEIGLTFSHLAEGVARLDVALSRAVQSGQIEDRARLRTAYFSVLYHVDELRRAEPARVAAARGGTAYGEFPMAPPDLAPLPIDRIAADRLPGFTPPHRHGLGAMAMPDSLHALWKGLSGGPSLEAELSRLLMDAERQAFAGGALSLPERLELAQTAARDMGRIVDLLRDGSILMVREHERAARSAFEALTGALAVGAIAALANLFALLLPLARKVDADREALALARDEARAAEKAKTEFLATMSHELRTPLNGVLGMAAVLDASGLDHRQRGCLRVIRSSAEALNGVIADILEYSRLDTGKLGLDLEAFAIERLGREPAARLAPAATLKGLDLMVRVDPSAPSMLVGDAEKLDHVVTNLLGNAIKFTSKGRVILDIGAERLGAGRALLTIEVRDTGPGVADADAERIFNLFTQADQSASRAAGGVGLGLSVCRTLMTMMGGRIGLATHAGPGATFRAEVELPVASDAPCVASDPRLVGARAVVLSGEPDRRRFLEELLSALGMRAESACDGVLLPYAAERFDVALLDHRPPGVDALSALGEMAETPSAAPLGVVVLATARSFAEFPDHAVVVSKPASPVALREGLAAALARRDRDRFARDAAWEATADQRSRARR